MIEDGGVVDDPGRPPEAGVVVRAARRHPFVVDALVVLGVSLAAFVPLVVRGGASSSDLVLSAGLIAPLIVRRRFPLIAFGVIAGVALVQWAVEGGPLLADEALLVGFATVAANRPARATRVAAAVLELGVALAVTRWYGDNWLPSAIFLSGLVAAAGLMGTNLRIRRAYLTHLEDRARRLERERDQQIQLAGAAERARIARELHDVVAHHLTVVITLADAAGRLPDGAAGAGRELMATVSDTGRTALTEMRRLLGVLRTERAVGVPAPDASGVARMQWDAGSATRAPQPDLDRLDDLVAQVRTAGLPVALTIGGDRSALSPGVELALYRAIQEALTNVLRHAAPGSRASVSLRYEADGVQVRVVDRPGEDGSGAGAVGSAGVVASQVPGNGLIGMRERIAACGGTVSAGPRADGGWEVRVEVPLSRAVGPAGAVGGAGDVGAASDVGSAGDVDSAAFAGMGRPTP
jgi:signal transduction histidine kinase